MPEHELINSKKRHNSMDDEPQAGGEPGSTEPAGGTRRKPRQRLWRRFVRYQMRLAHQRKAERERKLADEKPEEKAARKTATATVVIAVFTVVLALVSGFTLIEVILGGSDTHELAVQAKRQADKMKDVSDAADKIRQSADNLVTQEQRMADNTQNSLNASNSQSKTALDTTIQNARLDQRAWVTATAFRLSEEPTLNKGVTVTVSITNTGKTPAIEMVNESTLYFWNGEPPDVIPPALTPLSKAILAPNILGYSFTTEPLTLQSAAQMDAYTKKTSNIYVRALINYEDTFKRPHWTKVCAYHVFGAALDTWLVCEHGNEMDEYK